MALILRGKSECPLCGQVIAQLDEIVATSHFIADESDPLWRFSDAAFHAGCFWNWEKREEFVAKFNNTAGKIVWGNGTRKHMMENGRIVSVEVDKK